MVSEVEPLCRRDAQPGRLYIIISRRQNFAPDVENF